MEVLRKDKLRLVSDDAIGVAYNLTIEHQTTKVKYIARHFIKKIQPSDRLVTQFEKYKIGKNRKLNDKSET